MSKANIFLLLPETIRTIEWSLLNDTFHTKSAYNKFITKKVEEIDTIKTENYQGYFDNENLENFFEFFDTFDNEFPKMKPYLQRRILDWQNWRYEPKQLKTKSYKLFGQKIENHTLPEIAQQKAIFNDQSFAILNNSALRIQHTSITVSISERTNIEIDNLKNTKELQQWFSQNRIPQRQFHVITKHPEKDLPPRMWHGKLASYLHCSEAKATELLKTAIGESIDELFAYDSENDEFIVYKYENIENQNLYHGYHVPKNSDEVPEKIKNKLRMENVKWRM